MIARGGIQGSIYVGNFPLDREKNIKGKINQQAEYLRSGCEVITFFILPNFVIISGSIKVHGIHKTGRIII
jgi:hypothetical protein